MKNSVLSKLFPVPFVLVLLILTMTGCNAASDHTNNPSIQEQSRIKLEPVLESALYPALDLKQILAKSPRIIRGTVIARGESFEKSFGDSDRPIDMIYTPVTLRVNQWIYGESSGDTIVYDEVGGETATKTMDSNSTKLNLADQVVIFLNADGYLMLPYNIYPVGVDQTIRIPAFICPDMKSSADAEGLVRLSVDDFMVQVEKTSMK